MQEQSEAPGPFLVAKDYDQIAVISPLDPTTPPASLRCVLSPLESPRRQPTEQEMVGLGGNPVGLLSEEAARLMRRSPWWSTEVGRC